MAVQLTPPGNAAPFSGRVHVIGAGPVGLLMTALLQSNEAFSVRLYEKRREYTRTRMVQLASYLVADSRESYRADHIDGENVDAVFEPPEVEQGIAFRRSIPPDLSALLHQWTLGFCPLNAIERSLSDLIDARGSSNVQRVAAVVEAKDAIAMLEPGDVMIDSAGSRSLLRDQLLPFEATNTLNIRLEYAIVVTSCTVRRTMFDAYELYTYKQWLRAYMRSKMIKHNKDLFERVDDPVALLEKLHIY